MKKKIVSKKATKKAKNAIKKTAKKPVVKKAVKKTPDELFGDWWLKVAEKKVTKIENQWVKENEPNDPDDEGGGDFWCVNEMMHNGDACEMTYDIAKDIFIKGYNNEPWNMEQTDSLYCELDDIIMEAYPAGKKARK